MSELKAKLKLMRPMDSDFDVYPVYCREDVDTVITEKDAEIAKLKEDLHAANEQVENLINSASSIMLFQDKVNGNTCQELRHNKYKRCLDMSRWCDTKADWYYSISGFSESFRDRVDFYIKWRDKWRELSQKFKERI